jgi:AcrR family transcriptional regulator
MPRSEHDNQQIRASRRSEILAAATRVFVDKGLVRTKVTDIAAAANLSNGLLYHYFPSKDAVFEAIAMEMMSQAEAELNAPHDRAADRLIHAVLRRREQLDHQSVDASRVIMQAVLQGEVMSESLRRLLSEHLLRLSGLVCDLVAEAQRDGDIDGKLSAEELTRAMMFLFRGMSIRMPHLSIPLPQPETILVSLRLTAAGTRRAARALQLLRPEKASP